MKFTANLIDLDKKEKQQQEELAQKFKRSEIGCDSCLLEFPEYVQVICFELIDKATNERDLVRLCDNSDELREALGKGDSDGYMKEVDAIVRYYKFINEVEKVA